MIRALADMGVPMIGVYWPPAWLAFIPVVLIEAWWAWWARRLLGSGWSRAIVSTFVANTVSTLVGIPVAWCLWAILELRFFGTALGLHNPGQALYAVTVQAAWLIPYNEYLWWMVPTAALVSTGVFFGMSVWIEGVVMRWFHPVAERRSRWGWAWKANLASYGVIVLFVLAFLYVPREALDHAAHGPVFFLVGVVWRAVDWLVRLGAQG